MCVTSVTLNLSNRFCVVTIKIIPHIESLFVFSLPCVGMWHQVLRKHDLLLQVNTVFDHIRVEFNKKTNVLVFNIYSLCIRRKFFVVEQLFK